MISKRFGFLLLPALLLFSVATSSAQTAEKVPDATAEIRKGMNDMMSGLLTVIESVNSVDDLTKADAKLQTILDNAAATLSKYDLMTLMGVMQSIQEDEGFVEIGNKIQQEMEAIAVDSPDVAEKLGEMLQTSFNKLQQVMQNKMMESGMGGGMEMEMEN